MSDLISRQAAIDALAKQMPRSHTPDGSHPADEEIFRAQEVFADCIEALEILPSAAPSTAHTTETTAETTAPSTDDWIPVERELPNDQALEFEPLNSIKTDGSIDRKAVIDFLSGITNLDPKAKGSLVMYVMSLPDVQPERKTGKWINEGRIIRCNKCKIGYATVKGMKSALTYNFCPNCGADMRKENES